jgi:hypothetical protein
MTRPRPLAPGGLLDLMAILALGVARAQTPAAALLRPVRV